MKINYTNEIRLLNYIEMKKKAALLMLGLAGMIVIACCDHHCQVEKAYPKLVPPIIVIGKEGGWGGYSVIVKDSRDSTLLMGNMSSRGKIIGASYNVGDTIK